ncbi:MAG: LOG family protein, partial [bacterium]|nr:LOG family protein [bacterium]
LTYASEVYVYFPGGLGTLNEFFEIITLVQTGKIRNVPIILFGREYWTPLLSFIEKTLYEKHAAIDEKDLKLYTLVDSVDEAYDYIIANITSC